MQFFRKREEVEFHIDRLRDSSIAILKSIILNPTLDEHEKFQLLCRLNEEHSGLASFIGSHIETGVEEGVKQVVESHR